MKSIKLYISIFAVCIALNTMAQEKEKSPEWQDLSVISINKLPARASFFHYNSEDFSKDWKTLNNYQVLNGTWKFNWVEKPADKHSRKRDEMARIQAEAVGAVVGERKLRVGAKEL